MMPSIIENPAKFDWGGKNPDSFMCKTKICTTFEIQILT